MDMGAKTILFAISIFSLILMAGCVEPPPPNGGGQNITTQPGGGQIIVPPDLSGQTEELKKFENMDEMQKWLKENTKQDRYYYDDVMYESAPGMDILGMATSGAASKAAPVAGVDYSATNVQVVGVDEADFVKTDGNYIYIIHNNELIIVDATNGGENSEVISRTEIVDEDASYYSPQAEQMFIYGERLVIFVDKPDEAITFPRYDITPRETYVENTVAIIYDISNREAPEINEVMTISGSYYQSRMIGDKVYVITREDVNYYSPVREPMIYYDVIEILPPVYYFDHPEDDYVFHTIASIDVDDEEIVDAQTFLMGYGNTMMMSTENMYIAYQKYDQWYCYWCYEEKRYDRERFFEVVVPLLPDNVANKIYEIDGKNVSEQEKWRQISAKLEDFFEPILTDEETYMDKKYYEELMEKIEDALAEYDANKKLDETATIIHKFGVDNGKITYKAKGAVHGYLLNQFSMDEFEGNLRVATTVDIWTTYKNLEYNNVYVLNEEMETIGSLERIAPDEEIYSARFMGKKLYLVTFKQIDPFFVIDLSNPEEPEILGALKIPGYSDYLHPYDENTIIGVGKETEENIWGGSKHRRGENSPL
ncbi:MAG: beta-propeller domain-containing protein [Candidatus Micrarchaeota archaeon]